MASPVAKSGKRGLNAKLLEGYRHELGTLLEAAHCAEICDHPECDLILHLIATHHGFGRPHFEPDAADIERTTDENQAAMTDTMRRFGRLQQRFGRWRLAWLESLLRCADALASAGVRCRQETQQ